jgi:hypothetical protein
MNNLIWHDLLKTIKNLEQTIASQNLLIAKLVQDNQEKENFINEILTQSPEYPEE